MDFNKSFLAYDTIDGARCQTSSRKLSQCEAAIEAVRAAGLNQTPTSGWRGLRILLSGICSSGGWKP